MPTILFVCTANQFRSPIAAACFSRKLVTTGQTGSWIVGSAGTWAVSGLHAHPKAIEAAASLGLDLSKHITREVDSMMLDSADLVVVMERGHKEALEFEFPAVRTKIILLGRIVNNHYGEVPDPASDGFAHPKEAAALVCDCIEKGFSRLIELATHSRDG